MPETFSHTLQENLITLLAYHPTQGRVVANMLDPNLMEGDYRLIAERCIDYWRLYKIPPAEHAADLFAEIIEDKHNRRAKSVKRVLTQMAQLSESINAEYVMRQLKTFQRMQRIKGAIIESADKINANAQLAISEIEEIWANILRTQEQDFEPGLYLNDYKRVIERLEKLQSEFSMGIPVLDQRKIQPLRGALMVLLAAAGRGKTWGLVHIGATALNDRKKVLHLTGEMDCEFIAQRYYQSMFRVAKRAGNVDITQFDLDEDGDLIGLERETIEPAFPWERTKRDQFTLDHDLQAHIEHVGEKRMKNLLIKRFQPDGLTINGLRAYLDTLETAEGFVPDMIILDYLGLMKLDLRDKRGSMGQNTVGLRAVAIEYDAAMITAHQGSKAGEEAAMMSTTHVAEDWSIIGTADFVITYSCTKLEFQYGLARLFVGKARGEEDRFAVLITQAYKIGAFCMESHYLGPRYADLLKQLEKGDEGGGEADEDDDD